VERHDWQIHQKTFRTEAENAVIFSDAHEQNKMRKTAGIKRMNRIAFIASGLPRLLF
jgi:hypothetical protein